MTFVTGPMYSSLIEVARETERHVASAGWDQPLRLFALVETSRLLEAEPTLRDHLSAGPEAGALSAIEQDDLPAFDSLAELLGYVAWPPEVDGAAVVVERIVVPPGADGDLPADPDEATKALAAHPERADVRLLVAVLRDGHSTCLLRQRRHDSDDQVALGPEIAPALVEALAHTLLAD